MAPDQDPSADEVGFDLDDELGDDVDNDEDDSELDALQAELKLHDYTDHVGSIEILSDVDEHKRLAVGWKGEVPVRVRDLLAERGQSHLVQFYPAPYNASQLNEAVVDVWLTRFPAAGISTDGGTGSPNGSGTGLELLLYLPDKATADRARQVAAEAARDHGVPIDVHVQVGGRGPATFDM